VSHRARLVVSRPAAIGGCATAATAESGR